MDIATDVIAAEGTEALSYDDDVAYEAQLPTEAELAATAASLANRISTSKVYLLSESSAAANRPLIGKRKHDEDDEGQDKMMEDEDIDENLSYRTNAVLLNGTPIAHLPTARIFAYATHFDAHPLGLEWVDDNTCVLVFESRKEAREAYSRLQKTASEEPDMDDCISARPFPIALWPPEERINQTLGQGQGLKGVIRMRWAKHEDVKKKGAMKESKFYKKHGSSAGKELFNGRDLPPPKRRRRDDYQDDELRKAELDNELDQFLAEEDTDDEKRPDEDSRDQTEDYSDIPASPPSKMRSDYISGDGRTLLERTSLLRVHNIGDDDFKERHNLASRLTAPLPRRSRQRRRDGSEDDDSKRLDNLRDRLEPMTTEKLEWGPDSAERRRRGGRDSRDDDNEIRIFGASNGSSEDNDRGHRRRGGERERERQRDREHRRPERPARAARTGERPKKTQQELDDELDAFLRSS